MNTWKAFLALGLWCASCSGLLAGPEFQFKFKGTAWQTNQSGQVSSSPVTEQTILQQRAARGGITDLSTLAIVYHVEGNAMGDTIDIVNPTTGAVLDTVIGLYFGDAFGRRAFVNRAGTQERRIDYVYTEQNDHSLGFTLTTKIYKKDAQGNRAVTSASGPISWLEVLGPNNVKFYSGTFSTGKAVAAGP